MHNEAVLYGRNSVYAIRDFDVIKTFLEEILYWIIKWGLIGTYSLNFSSVIVHIDIKMSFWDENMPSNILNNAIIDYVISIDMQFYFPDAKYWVLKCPHWQ